ncbi:MAG: NHL repeat-containing protein [Thermomicrobiales bacterium]
MDDSQFAALLRAIAATRNRRAVAQGLASIPLLGASTHFLDPDAEAKRKHRGKPVHPEKKKKKKKKPRKPTTPPPTTPAPTTTPPPGACNPECPQGQRCCNNTCITGPWTNVTTFGSEGTTADQFSYPWDVGVAADGRSAIIAERGNSRLSVWTRPASSVTEWSNESVFGENGLQLMGLDLAADGETAWVTNATNNDVAMWIRINHSSSWGNPTTFGVQGSNPADSQSLTDVALSTDGETALVTDAGRHLVTVWTRSGSGNWTTQTTFGSQGNGASNFNTPSGITLSTDSRTALIADTENGRVSVWTRSSATSTDWANHSTFGSGGTGAANLASPKGVELAPDGLTAWVADSVNNRVSIWHRLSANSQSWFPVARFGSTFEHDGDLPSELSGPSGVAITPDGLTVWVADYFNHRISVWTLTCPP